MSVKSSKVIRRVQTKPDLSIFPFHKNLQPKWSPLLFLQFSQHKVPGWWCRAAGSWWGSSSCCSAPAEFWPTSARSPPAPGPAGRGGLSPSRRAALRPPPHLLAAGSRDCPSPGKVRSPRPEKSERSAAGWRRLPPSWVAARKVCVRACESVCVCACMCERERERQNEREREREQVWEV